MQHKHSSSQTRKTRRSKERQNRIEELAELLWDETKPEGEEGVPEEQWVAVLMDPASGDLELIAEVCAYERGIRSGDDGPAIPLTMEFVPEDYAKFVQSFFIRRIPALGLLWDNSTGDWLPEERWEELLAGTDRFPQWTMKLARRVRAARETGRYVILA